MCFRALQSVCKCGGRGSSLIAINTDTKTKAEEDARFWGVRGGERTNKLHVDNERLSHSCLLGIFFDAWFVHQCKPRTMTKNNCCSENKTSLPDIILFPLSLFPPRDTRHPHCHPEKVLRLLYFGLKREAEVVRLSTFSQSPPNFPPLPTLFSCFDCLVSSSSR